MPCGRTPRSGYEAGRMLAADPDITAVLCGNDDLALGVMRAAQESGRTIPGDLSVVGFDDTPVAEFLTPPLTTVRMDFTGLGRACFAALLAVTQKESPVLRVPRPVPGLIVRASAARPARPALDAHPRKRSIS